MVESAWGSMGHFLHYLDPDIRKVIRLEHLHLTILKRKYFSVFNRISLNPINSVSRVLAHGPKEQGSIPGWVIPKNQKWYLMPPCLILNIIRYGSRIKWSNPGKGGVPTPTLGVIAIEKWTFGSPSFTIVNFVYIYIYISSTLYIYIYIYICMLPNPCRVELSSERSNGCHERNARLFIWIELSVAVKRIYVNKKQMWYISV